jgi:hypothetical protein
VARNQPASAEIEALRTTTREAHEALKDLRAERAAVTALLAQVRSLVATAAADEIDRRVSAEVAAQVEALGKVTSRAMSDSVAKVGAEFERLAALYLGAEDGGPSLHDLAIARQALARANGG